MAADRLEERLTQEAKLFRQYRARGRSVHEFARNEDLLLWGYLYRTAGRSLILPFERRGAGWLYIAAAYVGKKQLGWGISIGAESLKPRQPMTGGGVDLIFNMRLLVYALAIVLAAAVAQSAGLREDKAARRIGATAAVVMNALALRALSLEVEDYYSQELAVIHTSVSGAVRSAHEIRSVELARDFTYSTLWMAYGAMLMAVGFWRSSAFVRWQALVLIAVTTVKIFVYDTSQLDRIYRILSFTLLGVVLLAISFVYQRDWLGFTSKGPSTAEPRP